MAGNNTDQSWIGGRLVVMGASAGGLDAISRVASALPANFPAPVVFVMHLDKDRSSLMDVIVQRKTKLRVVAPHDDTEMQPGHLYVAVPDRDFIFEGTRLQVVEREKDQRFCPSIDRTLFSAAEVFGNRLIAVLMTGLLDDGVAALQSVYVHGGLTIVQDPGDAKYPSMPSQAVLRDHPNSILPLSKIPARLIELVGN